MCYWILNVGMKHLLDVWSVLLPPDTLWQEEVSQHQISLLYLPGLVKQTSLVPCHWSVCLTAKTAAVALISLPELRETLYCLACFPNNSLSTWCSLFPNSLTYKCWLPSNEVENRIKKWVCGQGMAESANGVFWYFYFPRFLARKGNSEDSFCHF